MRLSLLLVGLLATTLLAAAIIPAALDAPRYGLVSFGRGINLWVEIAESEAAQARGLSGRDGLMARSGMIFLFADDQIRTFWMEGMSFPLDIIWIDDQTVVGFQEAVQVGPGIYRSPVPADMVLEVEVGFVEQYHIQVGQRLLIDLDLGEEEAEPLDRL